jgi:hypothetical protein
MSVPSGIITPSATPRPAQFPTQLKHPKIRLQEGQYETSVPVIADRCLQAVAVNALEPEWEARFEPRVRHEAHCCIARATGRDERRYLWI